MSSFSDKLESISFEVATRPGIHPILAIDPLVLANLDRFQAYSAASV